MRFSRSEGENYVLALAPTPHTAPNGASGLLSYFLFALGLRFLWCKYRAVLAYEDARRPVARLSRKEGSNFVLALSPAPHTAPDGALGNACVPGLRDYEWQRWFFASHQTPRTAPTSGRNGAIPIQTGRRPTGNSVELRQRLYHSAPAVQSGNAASLR